MNTGIGKNYFTMVVLLLSALLSSCSPESKKEDLSNEDNNVFYYDSLVGSTNDSLKVYLKNDSLFFIMSANRKRVVVPWNKRNFYPDQKLKGIFTLRGEQLEKQEVLEMGNKILYTILDEQYRGQMYVISLTDLSFYRDEKFNRDFLVSNSGMYLLDKNRERLIVVDKPILDEESEDMISPIFIYEIKDGAFNLIDKSKVKGELIYSDSLVYSFFKDYIKSK